MNSVLSRRTKNNPAADGEPGVGKTAVVEAGARTAANVPEGLKNKKFGLDMGALVAGAKHRGRVRGAAEGGPEGDVTDAEGEDRPFIDELHTGGRRRRGGAAIDASNMLKPMLARGELHTMRTRHAQRVPEAAARRMPHSSAASSR